MIWLRWWDFVGHLYHVTCPFNQQPEPLYGRIFYGSCNMLFECHILDSLVIYHHLKMFLQQSIFYIIHNNTNLDLLSAGSPSSILNLNLCVQVSVICNMDKTLSASLPCTPFWCSCWYAASSWRACSYRQEEWSAEQSETQQRSGWQRQTCHTDVV